MSIPRCHLDASLTEGALLPGTEAEARHLGLVLRRGPGDAVRLFNARDGEWDAAIETLRKDRITFRVQANRRAPAPEPGPALVFALLKREPMDWLVEKATELGVARLMPVITARTMAERTNPDRLAGIARAAAEQCERLSLPALAPPQPLHACLDSWAGGRLWLAAERRAAPGPAALPQGGGLPGLLVGPEGGFTGPELDDALRRAFVAPVSLGPRILRAETAAIAGLAALQALAGDWL
jgi:16S rRNA (uracil1498-N3)-methyltransferase